VDKKESLWLQVGSLTLCVHQEKETKF
jgi:hypothetical protein